MPFKTHGVSLQKGGTKHNTERLVPLIGAAWFNADKVREMANDWDFSAEGRVRQSNRMKSFADFEKSHGRIAVCDFVCPTVETRRLFGADFTVWLDTIKEGRHEDTNRLFERPTDVEIRITEWNEKNHHDVAEEVLRSRGRSV